MNRSIVVTCVLLLATPATQARQVSALQQSLAVGYVDPKSSDEADGRLVKGSHSPRRCTLIYASDKSTALAGSNEDSTGHLNEIWYLPREEEKFGRVYFGLNIEGHHIPQGGMNDQGLFYDGASAEAIARPPRDPSLVRHVDDLHLKAMEECSTVEEVLKLYESYRMSVGDGQVMFGDRFGNSVIMEATGSIVRKKKDYQIATNFFQSRVKPEEITDVRYRIADEILQDSERLSVDLFRRVLSATHWESYPGSTTTTLYSYICDLKKGDIYIYQFHDFEDVVKINLRKELKQGERRRSISSLFPYDTYAARQHKAQWILEFLKERAIEKGVEGADGALALFREIRRGSLEEYRLSVVEGHLIALGYELLDNLETKQAIKTFEFAVSEYPESARAYYWLAESHLKNGDTQNAIKNYRRSLELDSENDDAREMLTKLDGSR